MVGEGLPVDILRSPPGRSGNQRVICDAVIHSDDDWYRWSELPIDVTVFQVVLLVQRRPKIETSGVDVEPLILLAHVGEPSFNN